MSDAADAELGAFQLAKACAPATKRLQQTEAVENVDKVLVLGRGAV
jgi:hypothetical protein